MADFQLNAKYLDRFTLGTVRQIFNRNAPKSIQLREIFNNKSYHALQKELRTLQWAERTTPDMFSYRAADVPKELLSFVSSPEFRYFVSHVTNSKLKKVYLELCAFGQQNYTLLHDKILQPEGIFFQFEFTKSWNSEWGGYTSFVKGENELLRINPMPNTLTLVAQDQHTRSFVKYVNHLAEKNKRLFVRGVFV